MINQAELLKEQSPHDRFIDIGNYNRMVRAVRGLGSQSQGSARYHLVDNSGIYTDFEGEESAGVDLTIFPWGLESIQQDDETVTIHGGFLTHGQRTPFYVGTETGNEVAVGDTAKNYVLLRYDRTGTGIIMPDTQPSPLGNDDDFMYWILHTFTRNASDRIEHFRFNTNHDVYVDAEWG